MIIHKNYFDWVSKFKPGVRYKYSLQKKEFIYTVSSIYFDKRGLCFRDSLEHCVIQNIGCVVNNRDIIILEDIPKK